ncbi:unnamed protein product [Bursaphelenchus okinawaensis]|uniref:Uncharacterized protein n=1 Tax=Bursaphelenchus okinawaensis TaxID=465554 RepID=A0A811JUL9_9BILA|nr:unnamed protein product [Bursaphelenchus okinawaensis]CAG9084329.1 unnamed protein product [Bursaphelenchus okinawaensis]
MAPLNATQNNGMAPARPQRPVPRAAGKDMKLLINLKERVEAAQQSPERPRRPIPTESSPPMSSGPTTTQSTNSVPVRPTRPSQSRGKDINRLKAMKASKSDSKPHQGKKRKHDGDSDSQEQPKKNRTSRK